MVHKDLLSTGWGKYPGQNEWIYTERGEKKKSDRFKSVVHWTHKKSTKFLNPTQAIYTESA